MKQRKPGRVAPKVRSEEEKAWHAQRRRGKIRGEWSIDPKNYREQIEKRMIASKASHEHIERVLAELAEVEREGFKFQKMDLIQRKSGGFVVLKEALLDQRDIIVNRDIVKHGLQHNITRIGVTKNGKRFRDLYPFKPGTSRVIHSGRVDHIHSGTVKHEGNIKHSGNVKHGGTIKHEGNVNHAGRGGRGGSGNRIRTPSLFNEAEELEKMKGFRDANWGALPSGLEHFRKKVAAEKAGHVDKPLWRHKLMNGLTWKPWRADFVGYHGIKFFDNVRLKALTPLRRKKTLQRLARAEAAELKRPVTPRAKK